MKKNTTKRSLLASVLALAMCVTMLVGTTFAWFTDSASTSVNRIQAGTLNVDIVDESGDSLDGKSLSFRNVTGETNIFWEPGATFFTQGFKIVNEGDLALKYKVVVSGLTGDAKLLEAIDFAVVTDNTKKDADAVSFAEEGQLLTKGASAPADNAVYYYLRGHMKEDANNDYQGLTLEGVSITVYATQYTYENDSFNNEYDANAGKDTAFYSLADFNKLTEIPAGVKNVYVDLGGKSLEGGITIGNANMVDDYEYFTAEQTDHGIYTKDMNYKKTLNVNGVKVEKSLYSTEKSGFNLILTGSVLGAKDTGSFNAGMITLSVPDACSVTFEKVNFGAGQMALRAWYEALSYDPAFHTHKVASIVFDGCTFNGNWLQNGDGFMSKAAATNDMSFVNCTFNKYENTAGINSDGFDTKNNSNPIWIQNLGQCNVTIEGCTINAVRPIKLWEGEAGGAVTIRNNTFNMDKCSIDTDATHKNVAVMFCGGKLDNVEITGNTVTGNATALICFYNKDTLCPTMNDGASFKLSDNVLNGAAAESVLWKTTTKWTPDYVNK